MENNKNDVKVTYSYSVTRFDNGEIAVDNIPVDGVTPLSKDEIYSEILVLGDMIEQKKTENAVYRGIAKFFADLNRPQPAPEASAPEAPVDGSAN